MATELRCLHGVVAVTLGHAADPKLRLLCSAPQGDNDPVDVVEIGSTKLDMGGVYEARPFCAGPKLTVLRAIAHNSLIVTKA